MHVRVIRQRSQLTLVFHRLVKMNIGVIPFEIFQNAARHCYLGGCPIRTSHHYPARQSRSADGREYANDAVVRLHSLS